MVQANGSPIVTANRPSGHVGGDAIETAYARTDLRTQNTTLMRRRAESGSGSRGKEVRFHGEGHV